MKTLLLSAAFLAAALSSATACPFCYGDTTADKMGIAADWGIIAMVIIMFAMLSALGAFMWYLAWRAKNPLPDYSELLEGNDHSADLPPHSQPEAL